MLRKVLLTVAVAVPLVAGGSALAAADGRAAVPGKGVEVVRLTIVGTAETKVDLGPKGSSAADQEIVALNVLRDGKKIGEGGFVCQFVRVSKSTATDMCTQILSLPDGQITAQGLVTSTAAGPGTYSQAITGGTGAYRTVRGEVKVTSTTTNRVPVTLFLVR